jgi:UDPglucose 6-dehydrogenase
MVPGMGDAGACHPRDNIALRWLADEYEVGYDMFDTIMRAREVQAENLARFVALAAVEAKLPIVIHGKAYKPDVPYTIGSYSTLIGHYLEGWGHEVLYADPLTGDILPPIKAVVLLAHSRAITYAYTDLDHGQDTAYFDILEGSVLIDPWRRTDKNLTKYKVIHYGNTRK